MPLTSQRLRTVAAACAAVLFGPVLASAQEGGGCRASQAANPSRTILQCAGGLRIEAEQGTQYRLVEGRSGLQGIDVSSRAVLIDQPPKRAGGFQVQTPHAVASVRGTVYAVDVGGSQTAVFVARGRVAVSDGRAASVLLRAGQGVDVVPGQPLQVKTWGVPRARALLARFGR